MKRITLLAAFTFLPLLLATAAPPALPIDQALKLAQDYLVERGLADAHPIESLTLEKSSFLNSETYWLARWHPAIKVEEKTQTSLRINMDGSLVLFTTGPGSAAQRPGKHRATR